MKIRLGHVSNSSASSFVIAKYPPWIVRVFQKIYLKLCIYKMVRYAKGQRKMTCKHCDITWFQHKSRKISDDCGCIEEEFSYWGDPLLNGED